MMLFPQLPLYAIAIICGILSFLVTRLSMPRIIRKLEKADIVGKDLHKSWKPIVAGNGWIRYPIWIYNRYFFRNMYA